MRSRFAVAVVVLAGLLAVPMVSVSAEDKVPGIGKIMSGCFNKKKGVFPALADASKAKEIKWDDVQPKAKVFAELSSALPKNKPEKGPEDSWKKLSQQFADNGKALNEAAQKKDADAFKKVVGNLGNSCGACHKVHKD